MTVASEGSIHIVYQHDCSWCKWAGLTTERVLPVVDGAFEPVRLKCAETGMDLRPVSKEQR